MLDIKHCTTLTISNLPFCGTLSPRKKYPVTLYVSKWRRKHCLLCIIAWTNGKNFKGKQKSKKKLVSPSILLGCYSLPPYHNTNLRLLRSLLQMRVVISKTRMGCSAEEWDKGKWTQKRVKRKALMAGFCHIQSRWSEHQGFISFQPSAAALCHLWFKSTSGFMTEHSPEVMCLAHIVPFSQGITQCYYDQQGRD